MKMPTIGTKVMFRGTIFGKEVECVGFVETQYPSHSIFDTDEYVTKIIPDYVAVRVPCKPHWWPYANSDIFTPEVSNLVEC